MSLIACTRNFNFPFLLGDILISSSSITIPFILPTVVGDISYLLPDDDEYFPVEVMQKIYVLNDNICVALAGKVQNMKTFLTGLKERCLYWTDFENKEKFLFDFITEYDERFLSEISIFILFFEEEGDEIIHFKEIVYGGWFSVDGGIFQKAQASGTGASTYLKEALDTHYTGTFEEGSPHRAVTTNMSLMARLLGKEHFSLSTVKEHWGAGFESIFFDGKSFKKLGDITYLIWKCRIDSDGYATKVPTLMMHYKYYGNVLSILSLEMSDDKFYSKLFLVPPLDYNPLTDKLEIKLENSFTANRVAMCFNVERPFNELYAISSFSEGADIQILFTEKRLELKMNPDVDKYIAETTGLFFKN